MEQKETAREESNPMKKRKPKYNIGDLWLVQRLPPLLFIYTQDLGWILHEGGLSLMLWLIEHAERPEWRGLFKLYKSDKPPPGARRLA